MAAGLGFKTFAVGEVLSAANVNGYLMQGVLVFANATARDAAITSPQEGQFAYLKDTNVTTYYTGSAWANLDTTGMTNPMTTTGDTIYSSSGSTPARLAIGSTGNVLTVAGGVPTWAAPASGGGMTLLSTTTLSGATTTISSISGSHTDLFIVVNDVVCSAGFEFRVKINSATNKIYGTISTLSSGSSAGTNMGGTEQLKLTGSAAANDVFVGSLYITQYASTTYKKTFIGSFVSFDSPSYVNNLSGATFWDTAAISSLTFSPNTGTFSSGTVLIYGVK